jgi:peptidoglycan-associated lipoprotein
VQIEETGPYSMFIVESIRLMCSGPDPFFAFDSSKPMLADQPTMKNLIDCMLTGALRGRTIKLIGRTDPRGTAGLNADLGLRRAEKVKQFLVANGIEQGRIETASMGAEDAAQDPKDWGRDRRVQIELVPSS